MEEGPLEKAKPEGIVTISHYVWQPAWYMTHPRHFLSTVKTPVAKRVDLYDCPTCDW